MNMAGGFHGIATADVRAARYFSAVAGTMLARPSGFCCAFFPEGIHGPNFAVWFATLLATAILPLLSPHSESSVWAEGAPRAVVTVSTAWAWYIFLGWVIVALAGLARVALATIQVSEAACRRRPGRYAEFGRPTCGP